jgi:hypothetical protein
VGGGVSRPIECMYNLTVKKIDIVYNFFLVTAF